MVDRNEKRQNLIFPILFIMDIIIIIYMVLVKATIPLILFDTFVSLVLLIDIGFEIKHGVDKKKSLKDNIIPIIASIPYDLILLGSGLSLLKFLRLFRIIKILKIASIINPIIRKIEQINNKIHIDKLVIFIVGILLIGALIISLVEDISFLQSIYFVIITFISVGYGDITMQTQIGKIIAIIISLTSIVGIGALSALVITYFNIEKDSTILNLEKEVVELKKQNEIIMELLKNKEENK
ncbi:MAG: potassium channel family protein [archaeon]|nr:potassium channel family protein [archaeon]